MNYNFFLYFLFVLLTIPLVIAAGTNIEVSISNDILNLYHGESETVSGTITNKNTICEIFCELQIDSNKESLAGISKGNSKPFSFSITAPKKGVGSKDYSVTIHCIEQDSFWCNADDFADWSTIVVLNYDLSPEEKQAKNFLDSNLPTISLDLDSVSSDLNQLGKRMNSLPSNIKASDLESDYDSVKNKFDGYNGKYNTILDYYNDEDYLTAKNKFQTSLSSSINGLFSEMSSINTKVTERVNVHNELTTQIEIVNENLENFPTKLAALLKKSNEIKEIANKLQTLIRNFNSGNFVSYPSVDSELETIDSDISTKESSYQVELSNIINLGIKLINSEYNKLCVGQRNCPYDKSVNVGPTKEVEDVDKICNKINTDLKQAFAGRNQELMEK